MSIPKLALNTSEAAAATGLSQDKIKRAIRSGKLRAKRSGELEETTTRGSAGDPAGRYLVLVDDLREWLDGLADA